MTRVKEIPPPALVKRAHDDDIVELLGALQLFADLDTRHLEQLASRCVTRDMGVGHLLFSAGDESRGLYIVLRGQVCIYRTSPEGRQQVLHVEGPGRPIAELPLLDGGLYPASAVTLEESRLVFLPRAEFELLYRTNSDVAHGVIRAMARRLRHFVHVAETLAFRDVSARLALLLADYASRTGVATSDGVEFDLKRTQVELARELGAARESVSRAFRQLRKLGAISVGAKGAILVPSVERLRALARGSGGRSVKKP